MQAIDRLRINLKGLMDHRGMTQREVAKAADTYPANVNRLLLGHAHDIRLNWAAKLAGALGFDLTQMLLPTIEFQKKFLGKNPKAA